MNSILVEVVYALPDRVVSRQVTLEPPATIAAALEASGIPGEYPDLDWTVNRIGVFGQRRDLNSPLNSGDRVEIYRPLRADPKETRRRRAEHARRLKENAKS